MHSQSMEDIQSSLCIVYSAPYDAGWLVTAPDFLIEMIL